MEREDKFRSRTNISIPCDYRNDLVQKNKSLNYLLLRDFYLAQLHFSVVLPICVILSPYCFEGVGVVQ